MCSNPVTSSINKHCAGFISDRNGLIYKCFPKAFYKLSTEMHIIHLAFNTFCFFLTEKRRDDIKYDWEFLFGSFR